MHLPPCSPVAPALPLHVFVHPLRPCLPTAAGPHAQSCHLLSDSLQDLKAFAYSNWVKSNTSCKKLLRMLAALIASTRLGHERPGAFAENPRRYSHRALFYRGLPRNTAFRGQDGGRVSLSVIQRSG
jgi:hypothetical protein